MLNWKIWFFIYEFLPEEFYRINEKYNYYGVTDCPNIINNVLKTKNNFQSTKT